MAERSFNRVQQDDPSLSLFTPESLREAEEAGELDIDSNILGLKPDPARLVQYFHYNLPSTSEFHSSR